MQSVTAQLQFIPGRMAWTQPSVRQGPGGGLDPGCHRPLLVESGFPTSQCRHTRGVANQGSPVAGDLIGTLLVSGLLY